MVHLRKCWRNEVTTCQGAQRLRACNNKLDRVNGFSCGSKGPEKKEKEHPGKVLGKGTLAPKHGTLAKN